MAEQNKKGMITKLVIVILVLAAVAGNVVLGSLYFRTSQELTKLKQDPETASTEEVRQIVAQVSKLIALPTDITPVLATVSDAATLKERQPFFKDAENGDKVLLYSNTTDVNLRKAYLYRPSSKQLLNVAPINIGNQVQPQEDQFSMEIRNGTATADLETQMETLLKRLFPNATVPAKGAAVRQNYEKSVLVQVDGSDEIAAKIAQLFNVETVSLPAGEAIPTGVDFLLILGGTQPEATTSPETDNQESAPTATPVASPET